LATGDRLLVVFPKNVFKAHSREWGIEDGGMGGWGDGEMGRWGE